MKRFLHLSHRYLGRCLGVLVTAWIVSGAVMIYVRFPHLEPGERCAGQVPLSSANRWVSPSQALLQSGWNGSPARVRLGSVLGRPVYHFQSAADGRWSSVFADSATPLTQLTPEQARSIAMVFHQRLRRIVETASTTESSGAVNSVVVDQWTVSTPLQVYRPFYRVCTGDKEGTEFYISQVTGEVVRDTSRRERIWNYLGAVTHWVYPTWLRRHVVLWRAVMRVLSGAGVLLAITGLILAVRRRRQIFNLFRGARFLHAAVGVVFGLPLLTWLFSGFLSFRVPGWFDTGEPSAAQVTALRGGELDMQLFERPVPELLRAVPSGFIAVEGEFVQLGGLPYLLARSRDATSLLIPASRSVSPAVREAFSIQEIEHLGPTLMPGASMCACRLLTQPDFHVSPQKLPLVRIEFDDTESTWFHISPLTGQLEERLSRRARLYRWLFDALHTFDVPWRSWNEPVRIGCLLVCISGVGALAGFGLRLAFRRHRTPPVT